MGEKKPNLPADTTEEDPQQAIAQLQSEIDWRILQINVWKAKLQDEGRKDKGQITKMTRYLSSVFDNPMQSLTVSQVDWHKRPKEHWCSNCQKIYKCPDEVNCLRVCHSGKAMVSGSVTKHDDNGPDKSIFSLDYALCTKCK